MGRNVKRRRERRDAAVAANGGRTRHQVKIKAQPRVATHAGKLSPAAAGLLVAGMSAWGAVRR